MSTIEFIHPRRANMQLSPYLNFDGQCEAALRFYEKCLGGTIEGMVTHGESPMAEDVPEEWRDRIMHARLLLGDQVIQGSDSPPGLHETPQGIYLSLTVDTPGEAERIFRDLTDGGVVTIPIDTTFWAERFGMLVDQFGTPWMISCNKL